MIRVRADNVTIEDRVTNGQRGGGYLGATSRDTTSPPNVAIRDYQVIEALFGIYLRRGRRPRRAIEHQGN